MITENKIVHADACESFNWKPIIAGALVGIGLSFLLNLFSVAIGLTAFTTTSEGVESIAIGGLIGTGIGIIASMFTAGWIAGYLGKHYCHKRHLGALYGFLTWSVSLVVIIFIASHLQQYIAYYGHFLAGTGETVVAKTANASDLVVTTNMPASNLVISAYVVFCLFFLSAFSCSLGGHCGMRHVCRDDYTV